MRLKMDGKKAEMHLPYGDKIMEYAPEANGRWEKRWVWRNEDEL